MFSFLQDAYQIVGWLGFRANAHLTQETSPTESEWLDCLSSRGQNPRAAHAAGPYH